MRFDVTKELGANAKITEVKLKKASIVTDSTTVYPENIQSITLQIGSSTQPFITVAVVNPVNVAKSTQEFITSNDKNLASYLSDKSFYLVLDPDFTTYSDDVLSLQGSFEFEINYTNN